MTMTDGIRILHNQHLPEAFPILWNAKAGKKGTPFLLMSSSEGIMLSQPYYLLSFAWGLFRGHLLTSGRHAIAGQRRSAFSRMLSSALAEGNLMIHPIKYLFTGHKPTSAMRVSEAWEWPQPAHTHTHTPVLPGIPEQNVLFLHHVVLNTES